MIFGPFRMDLTDILDAIAQNEPRWVVPPAQPFTCPVCGGRGHVPAGFYGSTYGQPWSSATMAPDPCRSCEGTGVVWQ